MRGEKMVTRQMWRPISEFTDSSTDNYWLYDEELDEYYVGFKDSSGNFYSGDYVESPTHFMEIIKFDGGGMIWQAAKEEFGDKAYRRVCYNGLAFSSNTEVENEIAGRGVIKAKTPIKLFKHDVEFYGDKAYLMWEISERSRWCQLQGNEIFSTINDTPYRFRRKTTAFLPFDIELAKAGDVAEYFDGNDWLMCSVLSSTINADFFEIYIKDTNETLLAKTSDLRMKYPPRAGGNQNGN